MNMSATFSAWLTEHHPNLNQDFVARSPFLMRYLAWEKDWQRTAECATSAQKQGCGAPIVFLRFIRKDQSLSKRHPCDFEIVHGDGGVLMVLEEADEAGHAQWRRVSHSTADQVGRRSHFGTCPYARQHSRKTAARTGRQTGRRSGGGATRARTQAKGRHRPRRY